MLHKIYRQLHVNLLGRDAAFPFPSSLVIQCPFPSLCLQGVSHPLHLHGDWAVSQSQENSTSSFLLWAGNKVLGTSLPMGCQVKPDLEHSTDELCRASDSGPKKLQSALTQVFIKQSGPGAFLEVSTELLSVSFGLRV